MTVRGLAHLARSIHPVDALLALVEGAAVEWAAWGHSPIGDPIAGPRPLVVLLPLLMAVPLLWRRKWPLAAWCLMAAGVCAQSLSSHHSAEGLETVAVLCVGPYSVASYGRRREAFAGLLVLVATYGIFAGEDANLRTGKTSEQWATAFFGLLAFASWLAGYVVNNRRVVAAERLRATDLERDRERVLAEERGRIARELHDIVSHNLSVVVLQASGARARMTEGDVTETLEKIETSGRTALVEMRRMLGVLRATGADASLSPQPGIADLADLVDSVRRAGVPITVDVCGPVNDVPSALSLSVYRIVQEALTNTLRHANASSADVSVRRDDDVILVEVRDRSDVPPSPVTPGHGLTGMRERATLLGGELVAGWNADGFVVRARLPLDRAAL